MIYSAVDEVRTNAIRRAVLDCRDIPGDMAELGVYLGGSALQISYANPNKTLHLFDTFEGIPQDDIYPEGHKKGDFKVSLETVKHNLAHRDNLVYHVGYFPSTALDNLSFSFVHVDGDLYQTTKDAIEYFWPRLSVGGIMVFDDYDWQHCPGVLKAVHEHFDEKQIKLSAPLQVQVIK